MTARACSLVRARDENVEFVCTLVSADEFHTVQMKVVRGAGESYLECRRKLTVTGVGTRSTAGTSERSRVTMAMSSLNNARYTCGMLSNLPVFILSALPVIHVLRVMCCRFGR